MTTMTDQAGPLPGGISAEGLLGLEPGIHPDAVVYLSGSHVEGLGTPTSDIDLYVIADSGSLAAPFVFEGEGARIGIHFVAGRRVDFEVWTERSVHELAARAAKAFSNVTNSLSLEDEAFIHRLRIGTALRNAAEFRRIVSMFPGDRFQAYLLRRAIERIDNTHEDLDGMFAACDYLTVYMRLRDLLMLTVDAVNIAHGHVNPRQKWRMRYLQLSAQSAPIAAELLGAVRQLHGVPLPASGPPDAALERLAEQTVALSNRAVTASKDIVERHGTAIASAGDSAPGFSR